MVNRQSSGRGKTLCSPLPGYVSPRKTCLYLSPGLQGQSRAEMLFREITQQARQVLWRKLRVPCGAEIEAVSHGGLIPEQRTGDLNLDWANQDQMLDPEISYEGRHSSSCDLCTLTATHETQALTQDDNASRQRAWSVGEGVL
jgi:hypothetical protein